MKRFLLAAGVAGGTFLALRHLPRHAATLHEHCSRCFKNCHEQPDDRR